MTALLEIRGLSLALGAFKLGPLSLILAAEEYLVLLGPSGCGKTTLLEAIAGTHPMETSVIRIDGVDAGSAPPEKRGVGYVSQDADLFPHLTVAENVSFGLAYTNAPAGELESRYKRIVEVTGVKDLLGRYPANLSGGESRRVALARALVVEPRLLLLDEPLSMLDPNARTEMLNVLETVHAEMKTAAIHVAHDREEAWSIGGRCAVMRDGRIVQTGTIGELSRRPKTRFVAEFLGGVNVFEAVFVSEGADCTADLGWAAVRLAQSPVFRRGFLQIRPESLDVSPTGTGEFPPGRIIKISDRGAYVAVDVKIGEDATLVAYVSAENVKNFKLGDTVALKLVGAPHAIKE